jgi:hypothetical protein
MKILFANGDSNTIGAELNPHNIYQDPQNAWPRWLSDKYNIPYVNIAVGGSGNEQICRSTITYISAMIELDNYKPEDIFVVILWTSFNRYEYWSYDERSHRSNSINSTHDPKGNVRKYVEYKTLIESDPYMQYKNLYYIYNTAKFLESYGIKYFFANSLKTFMTPDEFDESEEQIEMKIEYRILYEIYSKRISEHLAFHNKEDLFRDYLTAKGCALTDLGFKKHFSIEGQQAYAEFLNKKINITGVND